jgi:hypothetical protein
MFRLKSAPSIILSSLFYNPWFYFLIFSIANIILSYTESAPKTLLLITSLVLFIFVLMALFFLLKNSSSDSPLYFEETIPTLSPLWFYIIFFLALLPRLFILFNSTWPIPDDGFNTFVSMELTKKWVWHFFFINSQIPPLSNWIQTLYFKWITPSIFSMRFFYFTLSLATIALTLWVTKILFSRSVALFCLVLVSFSFDPLYTSRFCFYAQPLLTFQLISLGVLGLFLKSKSLREYKSNCWKLGLVTGLGFWVAIQWPLQAFTTTLVVLASAKSAKKIETFLKNTLFWMPLSILTIPYLIVSLIQKNGDHMKYLLTLSPGGEMNRLNSFLSNWTSLFWGCDRQNSYGPVWGGLLNPIAGALFFIGFIGLIQTKNKGLSRWVLGSFLIFMIPGLITGSFDFFRNALVTPLLVFICALGIQSLSRHTASFWKPFALTLVLLFSSSLDMIHLWKTYHLTASGGNYSANEIEFSKAFQILKETNAQKGPGNLFWGFNADISDTTLDVATYSFNGAENPELFSQDTQWAAFVANANYKPFLLDQFPDAKFYWLGNDAFWNQGGLMLVLVFKDKKNGSTLEHWNEVNREFHNSTDDYFLNPLVSQEMSNYQKFLKAEQFIKGDRFLESIFYEKLAYFQRTNSDRRLLIALIKNAVQKGYPSAHLLVTEGLLWRAEGNYPEAEKAFKKVMRSRLNLTDAKKNLEILSLLNKAP